MWRAVFAAGRGPLLGFVPFIVVQEEPHLVDQSFGGLLQQDHYSVTGL